MLLYLIAYALVHMSRLPQNIF